MDPAPDRKRQRVQRPLQLIPLLFYTPEKDDFALQSRSNRQGRRSDAADPAFHREAVLRWARSREEAAGLYEWLVGEDVARELARIDLPLSTYTQWYWKIDLHNLLHFLTLRVDPHAQTEIRAYGEVMAGMLKRVAPLSYEAWIDYQVAGTVLSRGELEALRSLLEPVGEEEGIRVREGGGGGERTGLSGPELRELGLSGREVRELLGKLVPAERPDFELDVSRMQPAEHFAERMERAVPNVDRRE
ncbi:MAG TPA: FAD-dependent thymidylate synthase [Gemmatimonadota bacterium]|nr:FAD-dependent thymidylate synthase [Gemmatimonadota bacterium]